MRTVRASLGCLAFQDPIEAVDERWYEGVQEDWWHQNQMELILGGAGGGGSAEEGGARNANIQGLDSKACALNRYREIRPVI